MQKPYASNHHENRNTEIRPAGKCCNCRVCGADIDKGTMVFRMNYWGTITIICLECIEKFGNEATMILTRKRLGIAEGRR